METKRHSILARAAMTLLLVMLTAVTAWADEWPSYITNVVLVGGTESEAQTAKSGYSGYTWCSKSLNDGTSGDVIYIGYKTSNSANTNGGYITDFIVVDAVDHNPPSSVTCNGHTYYLCPADGGDYFANSNHGNLTSHASQGWNIYLYYTKEHFSDKRAVSSIAINDTKSGAIDCYKKDGTLIEENISLNRGVKNTPYVYMHIYTSTKVNRPYPEPTTISGLTYDGSPHQLIPSNYDSDYSGDVYFRLGTTGSYTSNVNSITATNAGTYTIYYYSGESYYGNSSVDYAHTLTATIAKSPNSGPTVTCADALESVGPSPSLTGTNLSTGTITYTYSTSQNGEYTNTKPTAAGTYWVKATIAGDNNCNNYTTAAVSFKLKHDWGVHNNGTTANDAYVISTTEDLNLLSSRVSAGNTYQGKFFKLGANITFNYYTSNNLNPIGTSTSTITRPFKGIFDGQGYTISGLNINKTSTDNVGLFGYAEGATIKNLKLTNSTITGKNRVGGIAGYAGSNTKISNCLVTSSVSVSGNDYVGGMSGMSGNISGCTSAANVSATSSYAGGIVGYINGTYSNSVDHCLYTGNTVTGDKNGAIVGFNANSATFTANYYTLATVGGCNGSDADGARKAVAINTADGVTVTPTGTATAYNISGITGYADNNGIKYTVGNSTKYYAGATEEVNLDITCTSTYESLTGYTDGNGNALASVGGTTYTLTMPATTVTVTPQDLWGEQTEGRDGSTADKAYLITSPEGLDLLAKKVNGTDGYTANSYAGKYFELGNDITYDKTALTLDLDGTDGLDSNFLGIGDETHAYHGNFDGRGHTISGLVINKPNDNYGVGLFGYNYSEYVKNLTVANSDITGQKHVGAIVGSADTGITIENCHVASDVTVTGTDFVGGIVGYYGNVKGCTSAATVSGRSNVGGIMGFQSRSTVRDCLYLGTSVTGTGAYVAAIIGQKYDATITNNYYTTYGLGGIGSQSSATGTDMDGALIAMSSTTMPDEATIGTAGTAYAYQGITAYENGLYYDGHYYYHGLWSGSGIENDPYVIRTTTELDKLASDVNGGKGYANTYFALGADIEYDKAVENNYTPIGNGNNSFFGTFDGKGHTISGIRISDTNGTRKAIFGWVDGTVKNLVVSDCRIEARQTIGGIVTYLLGTIENCHVGSDVTLSGNMYVGGIVASNQGGTIKGCTSAAKITGTTFAGSNANRLGGIAGSVPDPAAHPLLTDNLFTGTISGNLDEFIGAIVGWNNCGENILTNNYHTCSGMGGVGREGLAIGYDLDGATIAYELAAANAAMGAVVSTYGTGDYTGITAYENGLAYNGKFYSPSPWGGSGTEADPYVIYNTAGMDKLANDVNGGNDYQDTYFVLGNDIVYAPDVLTLDLDGDGNNDSNYMPVGNNGSPFMGNFDGQGHTISGISVNANGMDYIGVFGINDGTVKNLTVSGCLFAGNAYVSAIAGMNRGTVENCHLLDDVSVTGNSNVGGVVGENEGFVLGCTSAATLSAKEYAAYFGGIAGGNTGTLTDNLFTGTIGEMLDGPNNFSIGAITGNNNTEFGGMLTNNYYTAYGLGGVGNEGNTTGSDEDGALFAVSSDTKPDEATIGTAGTAYAAGETYEGITPYTHGLYYNGLYYYKDPNIVVWKGQGTAENPYVIRTTAELDLLASKVNSGNKYDGKYFELGADITYDGSENNFTPIGDDGRWFYGSFDGKGHTISGIRISDTDGTHKAVFGYVCGTVKNLVVSDCRIEAHQFIGGIVGYLFGGTIENCHVGSNVTLTGYTYVGGIAADIVGETIIGCTSAATITGTKDGGSNAHFLGGISGYASEYGDTPPTLTDNLFTGTISGDFDEFIGAIVGKNNSNGTTLTNNYYTAYGLGGVGDEGSVIGSDEAGAQFAVSSTTMPDAATIGTAGTAYAKDETYQGITPYTHGLFYGGRYYYVSIWGGSGTEDDPYVIYNTAGLNKLASDVNDGNKYDGKYFELGADITYNKTKENNFTPIGNIDKGFYGTFDGKGHTISGIRISETNGTYKAIFGRIGGTVKNLVVSDCHIEARQDIGGIVAELFGTIENCHVLSDVTLTGYTYVGGITANIERGTIIGCTSAATITGTRPGGNAYSLGGIASFASEYAGDTSTLIDNLFTGTISGNLGEFIGAIVGENNSDGTTLTNNYYTCSGLGGVGDAGSTTGSDVAGALFAVSSNTKPDAATIGTAGTAYPYQGIMPYTHGLYYGGLYYYNDPNIVAWAGQGTETTPYVIRTTAELDLLASKVSGGIEYNNTYFELGDDIAYDKSQENNYTPIGNNDYYFMGHFDGKGHKVSGLNIYLPENNHVGLFGFIYSGSVKNLTLTNSIIIGQQYVGSIAGQIIGDATIENCHVTSDCDVNGDYCVGGIVGITDNSTIGGCTSAATVSGKQYVGGIVCNNSSTIQDCLYLGTSVTATEKYHVGAIVGWNNSDVATLTNNYHTLSGVGGVGNEDDATSSDVAGKAEFAVSSTTKPDAATIGTAGTPYAEGETYQGITPYTHGLFYSGRYYWHGTVRRGDANGDSVVNISDAVAIVNYILGKEVPAGFNVAAADMNGDGRVTISDAVMLVNMIGSQP